MIIYCPHCQKYVDATIIYNRGTIEAWPVAEGVAVKTTTREFTCPTCHVFLKAEVYPTEEFNGEEDD